MKLFYVIAVLVVALMVLSPYAFLHGKEPVEINKVIIGYTDDHKPIYNDNPVVLYDSYGSAVRSIDPTTCGDTTSAGIQGGVFEGLYAYSYLERDEGRPIIIPGLAAEMPQISKDRLTYTFKIKKGVKYQRNLCFGKWNDEVCKTRTVKAEDFVQAFKRIADAHNTDATLAWPFLSQRIVGLDDYRDKTRADYKKGDFKRYDLPLEGIKAIDEHTLQIKLIKPYPQFVMVLALHNYSPCPREAIDYWLAGNGRIPQKERNVEFREAKMLVGTGAYILKVWESKHKIVFVRNPDYRKDFYPTKAAPEFVKLGLLKDAGKEVPFIDAKVLEYVAEINPIWMRFLSRQTDASGIPTDMFDAVITPGKDLTDSWRKKNIYLRKAWSPSVYWIRFNMDDPVLGASKSLRQAMCLCFDMKSYIDLLYNGRARRAVNCVPGTFKASKAAGPGPYYKYDLEAAKKKIAQAKNELAAKGLLDEDGEIPVIKLDLSEGTSAKRMAEFVRQQFAKIGVRIKPIFNDWPTLIQKMQTKTTQLSTSGWHADYYDAENFLQLFYGPNIKKSMNNSNYSNPKFDRLYDRIRTMADSPQRTKIYAEMVNIISEDCPVMMMTEPQSFVLYYDWVQNVVLSPIGTGYGKYRRLDVKLRKKLGGRK
ncbi:MAG: hypothetical protein K8S55_08035 [Phycisphaerae bacterium]|nr:hypothetical protein [Phycisphaerae bacterium]